MRKSVITIALVCAALVALCSCSSATMMANPVKPNVAASTPVLAAPVASVGTPKFANLTVNGAVFAGDPIMRDASGNPVFAEGLKTAGGDPIMQTTLQTAAGDPIMMDAAGNYYVALGGNLIMIAAAGDPIMLYNKK